MNQSDLKLKISERLKLARTQAGFLTAKEFAEQKGLKVSTYHLHEANTRSMSFELIEHYAALLDINTTWLLTGVGPKSRSKTRKVPIVDWQEALRYPANIDLQYKTWTTSDTDLSTTSFGLIVDNDAMEPRYPEGTVIIVDCEQKPKNKDFSVIHLKEKDCLIFKQIIQLDGEIYAKSLNPDYPAIPLSPSAQIIGKVIQAKLIF